MKRLCLLALLPLLAGPVAALDVGGFLDNTTGVAVPGDDREAVLIQRSTAALWMRQGLGSWTLDGQGSYTFTPTIPLLVDLDRLTLSTEAPATVAGATGVGLTIGRSRFADTTGHVLDHTLDGLKLRVSRPLSAFRFDIGTTALLQKPTNRIVLGELDILDLADGDRKFAPARLIATIDYRMLEAFAGQELALGVTVQEDLRPRAGLTPVGTGTADPAAGGRFDTQYASALVSGALGPNLYHRTYYSLNGGRRLSFVPDESSPTGSSYQYVNLLGHLAGAELTWFLPEILNSRARLFGQFSTGPTEWSDAFVPVAARAYSDVFSVEPGNSAHLGLSYSVRPFVGLGYDVVQVQLGSVAYVTSVAEEGSGFGPYLGTDLNLAIAVVPLSDLRFVLKAGLFVPGAGSQAGADPDERGVDYQVTLQGVLRF